FIVSSLLLAACGDDDDGTVGGGSATTAGTTGTSQTVTLALGGPFSGASKSTGDKIRGGARLAADEINNAGGITGGPLKGARIGFKEFDDTGVPAQGATNMRTIVDDKEILAFVGSGSSDVSVAQAPVASETGFPYLSAYGSSPKILEAATAKKSVFVIAPTFPAYAFSVTDELLKAGRTKPGIIHQTGTYGDGVADLVVARLRQKNMSPVAKEPFKSTDTDMRTQLAKIKDAEPDSLIMVGLAPTDALILKQADEIGLKVPAYDPGGITKNDQFLKDAGPLAEGVVGNTPSYEPRDTGATRSLKEGYTKATGESVVPDPAVFSYEGVRAVAAALAEGATGREDLPDHLRRISISDTGVGSLRFAADGSRIGGRLYVFRINNGKPEYFISYEQTGPQEVKEVPLG
ncbi:MAG: ABC transporter substrate-binding protein, partial [Actinobacteria bacterium]|nr:ABC transporter substrate-binding protein [Actinomycetota bacterium]